jgi:hypothetical protein
MESTNSIPLHHDLLKSLQYMKTEAHEHKYNVQVEDLFLQTLMDTASVHMEHLILYHFVYNQRWKLNIIDASRHGKHSIIVALDTPHMWKYDTSSYNMVNGDATLKYHDFNGEQHVSYYSIPDAMFIHKLNAYFKKQQYEFLTVQPLETTNSECMYFTIAW